MSKVASHNIVLVILLLGFFSFALSACSDSPIQVGFSGTLEGKYSDLGVQGRNGALFAVEEINSAGGIDGRKLQLIVRDDGNTPEGAVKADRELIKSGAEVIIGHMTSVQSMAALKESDKNDVVYISPTTSTTLLKGRKDKFFRVIATLGDLSESLAEYSVKDMGKKRLAVVWDESNRPFTEPYKNSFITGFEEEGGELVGEVGYNPGKSAVDWPDLVNRINEFKPDAVVAVIAARDLASFARYSRLNGAEWTIFSSMWGYTKELVQTGGKSVEGIYFAVHFAEDTPNPGYDKFKKEFKERFGWAPNFAAVFAYEAVQLFAHAVRLNGGSTDNLENVLPGISFSESLVGPYEIDGFGDVNRDGHIVIVKGGNFVSVAREGK